MDPPPLWANNGPLHTAKKELVSVGWEMASQSSKKLKGKVVKAGDIGLKLGGGGQAGGTCRRHAMYYFPLKASRRAIMIPPKDVGCRDQHLDQMLAPTSPLLGESLTPRLMVE